MPWAVRYSTIAWVIARMCVSLKAVSSDEPRWPLVPKATRWAGIETSGTRSKYACTSSCTSMRSEG